eukprot:2523935-Rhodomonas_salina.1
MRKGATQSDSEIFKGCSVFFINGQNLSFSRSKTLGNIVKRHRGAVATSAAQATHVVSASLKLASSLSATSLQNSCLVRSEWIVESVEKQKRLEENCYSLARASPDP